MTPIISRITFGLLIAVVCVALSIQTTSYVALAQTPVCRPFVYETIAGLPPIGARVTFDNFQQGRLVERSGVIVAYYWLPCWPGAPVIGLEDVAYVIDYGEYAPAGNRVDIILNRGRFEVVG